MSSLVRAMLKWHSWMVLITTAPSSLARAPMYEITPSAVLISKPFLYLSYYSFEKIKNQQLKIINRQFFTGGAASLVS